jgi:hypothetical protein
MCWATRTQLHVDRCASVWLIQRLIDSEAQLLCIDRDDPIPEELSPSPYRALRSSLWKAYPHPDALI